MQLHLYMHVHDWLQSHGSPSATASLKTFILIFSLQPQLWVGIDVGLAIEDLSLTSVWELSLHDTRDAVISPWKLKSDNILILIFQQQSLADILNQPPNCVSLFPCAKSSGKRCGKRCFVDQMHVCTYWGRQPLGVAWA